MNENENEHVSLVRIPRKWYYVFVWTFPTLIIVNVFVELFYDWNWKGLLGGTALERMAILMTLIVGWFFIVSHIWVGIKALWYALLKGKFLAEGANQLYRKLVKAEKDGKPFKEALEEHKPEN